MINSIICGQRDDARRALIQRQIQLQFVRGEGDDEKSNRVRVIASTNENYDWGYYKEQLLHDRSNVDCAPAASVLFNHNRDQVIGKILSTELDGQKMTAELEIDPEVTGSNGLKLLRAIRNGYLRGVSIGYEYRREDCTFSEDDSGKRSVVVNRWQLREISITPTPADVAAQVIRQVPEWIRQASHQKAKTTEVLPMGFEAWLLARGLKKEDLTADALARQQKMFDEETKAKALNADSDELKKERAARAEAERKLAEATHLSEMGKLARTHGVEWKDEDASGKNREQCITLMLERKAAGAETNVKDPMGVNIMRDAADKADEAAEEALGTLMGVKTEKNLGLRGGTLLDIGRRWLHARGERGILDIDRRQIAEMLLGAGNRVARWQRQAGRRDAANVTGGMFTSYLLANVMDKVIYNGFQASDEAITYPLWTASREVMDFKTFSGAALDAGNLIETTENTAFPELAKAEGGYSDVLALWGATVSLTLQAMQNDDLGEFMRWLKMAGFIARRTVDVKVYAALAAATWTSRTTVGNLSDDTLSTNRASMAAIAGPAGQTLGLTPRYLIVPAGLRKQALQIAQIAPYIAPEAVKVNTDIIPIITPFLPTAATPSQSTWYIAVSQMYEAVVVATLQGVNAPIIEEYDPGAVAARKWKIMFPFKVVIPTVESKVQGLWQGTNA